jgi:spermidine/putrescine transport system ATP-binding protein
VSGSGSAISPVTSTPAVAFTGLTKCFGEVVAVDHLDLSIDDGEFFALLGPSGCGKTTTLRMIAGLDVPTSGILRVFGNEVGTLSPDKRPVNTVFQNYALFPHMDVGANVSFGLRMQRVPKAAIRTRVAEALDLVQLSGYAKRRPHQLSGGQQQRVALARALVNRPKVLLLDEPLGALDLKLRREMQAELKTLQRELGITFVFVTHDQDEAMAMSDRIGVMSEGRLLQVGTPEAIYEHPSDSFVAGFVGHTNLLDATVEDASTVCLSNGVRVPAATTLPAGTSVAISLRPERATLAAPGSTEMLAPDDARLEGTVHDVTYLGAAIEYRVRLDWIDLTVLSENRAENERFGLGDRVDVVWHADAINVVNR